MKLPLLAFAAIFIILVIAAVAIMWELRQLRIEARLRDREIRRQVAATHDDLDEVRGHLDGVLAWAGLPPMPAASGMETGKPVDEPTVPAIPSASKKQLRHLRLIKGNLTLAALGALLIDGWERHPKTMTTGSSVLSMAAIAALLWAALTPGTPTARVPVHASTRTVISETTVTVTVHGPSATPSGRTAVGTNRSDTGNAEQVAGPRGRATVPTTPRHIAPSTTTAPTRPTTTTQAPSTRTSSPPNCDVAATVLALQIGVLCG